MSARLRFSCICVVHTPAYRRLRVSCHMLSLSTVNAVKFTEHLEIVQDLVLTSNSVLIDAAIKPTFERHLRIDDVLPSP